jgi:hypothetical protein
MDLDESDSVISERGGLRADGETIFTKSEQLVVSFYANLPAEVVQLLKNAGTNIGPLFPYYQLLERFLHRSLLWGHRYVDWLRARHLGQNMLCLATCAGNAQYLSLIISTNLCRPSKEYRLVTYLPAPKTTIPAALHFMAWFHTIQPSNLVLCLFRKRVKYGFGRVLALDSRAAIATLPPTWGCPPMSWSLI